MGVWDWDMYRARLIHASLGWLLAISVISCASTPQTPTTPQFVSQRSERDCAVAALAMATHRSYEAVGAAVRSLGIPLDHQGGLLSTDIIALGGALGYRLIPQKDTDPSQAHGILLLWVAPQLLHAVYVVEGQVFDPLSAGPQRWEDAFPHWEATQMYALLTLP